MFAPRPDAQPVDLRLLVDTTAWAGASRRRSSDGNRTIAAVTKHIEDEPLVHWGWTPGPGREPAPYSVAQVVEFLKQWDAAGAPCPAK